jgi:hypothetical protein
MEQLSARQILKALVQGIDPLTGAEVPTDSVLQQTEVLRALLAGMYALEASAVRTRRRAQLPHNVGRPWRAAEEDALASEFRAGAALGAIAAHHGRSLAAIEARLERLGLLEAAQRRTRNRYVAANHQGAPPAAPSGALQSAGE